MMARESRQSFLGVNSDQTLRDCRVAVVGLGGGGSHIAQQLAHLGVGHFALIDDQRIEDTNLNRLVGATRVDVSLEARKVDIAGRLVLGLQPSAEVSLLAVKWQATGEALRDVDVIFGCVDSYVDRAELERQARRYLIPYIDIGMDVRAVADGFHVAGQVAVSIPGHACMWCMGLLRHDRLAEEANRYGDAGVRQQVVWANGVLASTAVGAFVQLVTPWAPSLGATLLEYDANRGTVSQSQKLAYLPAACGHYGPDDLGDPMWTFENVNSGGSNGS